MSISFTWKIEELGLIVRGKRMVLVRECYSGEVPDDVQDRAFGPMPGSMSEAFVRARRDIVRRTMAEMGASPQPDIDWSFLEKKGTKQ